MAPTNVSLCGLVTSTAPNHNNLNGLATSMAPDNINWNSPVTSTATKPYKFIRISYLRRSCEGGIALEKRPNYKLTIHTLQGSYLRRSFDDKAFLSGVSRGMSSICVTLRVVEPLKCCVFYKSMLVLSCQHESVARPSRLAPVADPQTRCFRFK